MTRIPRVALLIETARGYGRQLLRGIVRYARLHGPWSFYITPGDFEQALPEMQQWGGTGIIARITTPELARAILESGLPTIGLDLSATEMGLRRAQSRFGEIHPDPVRAANLAADHLFERGFRRFAFVGLTGRIWSTQRQEAFTSRIRREGCDCSVYEPRRGARNREWGREQEIMAGWLLTLPKPIGLYACNDDRGRQVLEAALAAGVQVPDEVAVIGMDNDELLCELCDPPLSSVALNAERAGYEAAAMLDQMMKGRLVEPRQLVVEPLWVVTRRSTDVLAMEDRHVAGALRFIRENVARPIQVADVLKAAPLSRRALEMRFRRAVGRSIHEEIHRLRLERAKRLLGETDMPVEKVAESAGFGGASYLSGVFRKKFGMTPIRYRTHVRAR